MTPGVSVLLAAAGVTACICPVAPLWQSPDSIRRHSPEPLVEQLCELDGMGVVPQVRALEIVGHGTQYWIGL